MKNINTKRLAVIVLCVSFWASLFGCGKRHILDGPGMINPASWDSFTVSRSDSYAQHNFYINLEQRNEGLFVTGEVRGEDGTIYADEEGIRLSRKAENRIRSLEPALLPDCRQVPQGGEEALDLSIIQITVICTDGRILKKTDKDDFSIRVYQIVLPCFENKYNR